MSEAICMFNALWFRPDGGAARYAEYGTAVQPILADVGAELLFPVIPVERSLEGGLDADAIVFVRYPSTEAFDSMWQSDAYQAVAHLREEAITKAVLTRCEIDPPGAAPVADLPPGIAVLNALWFGEDGAAIYETYLEQAAPLVTALGGRFLSPRLLPKQAFGEDLVPDLLFLGLYPSTDALFELIGSEAYRAPSSIRASALRQSATTLLRVPDSSGKD